MSGSRAPAAWRRAARARELEDASSCLLSSPQTLTVEEVSAMQEVTTSPAPRHVATLEAIGSRRGVSVKEPATS